MKKDWINISWIKKNRKNLGAVFAVLLLLLIIWAVTGIISRDQKEHSDQETFTSQEPETTQGPEKESLEETVPLETLPEETPPTETQTEESRADKAQQTETKEPEQPYIEPEPPYEPPTLVVASDLHYQSHSITDFGKAYRDFIASSDGKLIQYLPELLDAFSEEVIQQRPNALILSGDITMNGEKENHQELSDKLAKIQESGIQVLVIPGNHDINNPHASYYFEDEKTKGQPITPEEFYEYYRNYGYDQARSRDVHSLSYVYELDERYWMMMLDTCQYEPVNLVGGRLKEETLSWMDGQLKEAKEAGVTVIPVGHHNLFPQSSLYTTDCAMDNYEEAAALLEKWELPVYVSGHLHVQRLKKNSQLKLPEERLGPGPRLSVIKQAEKEEEPYGIYEIISDSISITPCQYGVMRWDEEGNLTYQTRLTDVSGWADRHRIDNGELLDFENYSCQYIKELIARQIEKKMDPVSWEFIDEMTSLYADLYEDYYAGRVIDEKAVKDSVPWQLWVRLLPDSRQVREMRAMIGDSKTDNNYLYVPNVNAYKR